MTTHKSQVGQDGAGINGGEFAKKTQTDPDVTLNTTVTPVDAEQAFADVFQEYATVEDRLYRARLAAIDAHTRAAFPDGARVVVEVDPYEHTCFLRGFYGNDGKQIERKPQDPDFHALYQASTAVSNHAARMHENLEHYFTQVPSNPKLWEFRVTGTPRTIDDFQPVDVYNLTDKDIS